MSSTTVVRTIHAPIEHVFDTVAHIENFSKAVPHIVSTEILSEVKSGVGTRFRETRLMHGKEATTELQVTEYVENEHVRIVSDAGGTVWDSVFRVRPLDDGVELTLSMEARPYKWTSRLMNPLIRGMIQQAVEADLDSVKAYCEGRPDQAP